MAMATASDATGGDQTASRRTGLVVNNSIRKEKVPFVIKDGFRNDLDVAMREEMKKQQKKISDTEEELANASSSRQKDDLADRVKQEQLKLNKIVEAVDSMLIPQKEAMKVGAKEPANLLLGGSAVDILGSHLDAQHGPTDHAIFKSHTLKYENEFWADMISFGCGYPDVLVRVADYMDKIVESVQVIMENKLAYVANGSVYCDTKAFKAGGHQYGTLNPAAVGSSLLASESESNFETPEEITSCNFSLWKDQSVDYESQTPESLVDSMSATIYSKCSVVPKLEGEVAYPEMIVPLVGKELRSEDVSRSHSSGTLKNLQKSVAGPKFSVSIPYVTVGSDKGSVGEALLSHKALGRALKVGEVAVSGSCSVGRHDAKKLTDVPGIQAYISGRKISRVQGETDIRVICYSPSLDWNQAGISNSEEEVLAKVLSALKSSGTS